MRNLNEMETIAENRNYLFHTYTYTPVFEYFYNAKQRTIRKSYVKVMRHINIYKLTSGNELYTLICRCIVLYCYC